MYPDYSDKDREKFDAIAEELFKDPAFQSLSRKVERIEATRRPIGRLILAGSSIILGAILVTVAVSAGLWWLGIGGFIAGIAGAMWGMRNYSPITAPGGPSNRQAVARGGGYSGFLDRMAQDYERRRKEEFPNS